MRRGRVRRPGPLPGGGGCSVVTGCHVVPCLLTSERITRPGRGYMPPVVPLVWWPCLHDKNGRFTRIRENKSPKARKYSIRFFRGIARQPRPSASDTAPACVPFALRARSTIPPFRLHPFRRSSSTLPLVPYFVVPSVLRSPPPCPSFHAPFCQAFAFREGVSCFGGCSSLICSAFVWMPNRLSLLSLAAYILFLAIP